MGIVAGRGTPRSCTTSHGRADPRPLGVRIVDVDVWETVQDKLDDPGRITDRVGTDRKHLGSGLYLLAGCVDKQIKAHGQRYRCAGHIVRARGQVDAFVVEVIRRRLALPDLENLLASYRRAASARDQWTRSMSTAPRSARPSVITTTS